MEITMIHLLVGLLILSFLLALWGLQGVKRKIHEVEKVREELTRGRVIFGGEAGQDSSSFSSESSKSS